MPSVIHLRPLLIVMGSALIGAWFIDLRRRYQGKSACFKLSERFTPQAERHYSALLLLLTGSFFILAYLAKLSQLHALALHAEDFWLFEDMLAQMREGGYFLTRFAPQAAGWVQHGAVHPMFTWILTLPLAWIFGTTQACLSFEPLVFALAAAFLAALVKPRGGALAALCFAAAFLASNQVGRILMYDVHPEAAYPLFVFLWAWAAGWGDGRIRTAALIFATLGLIGIKEDSFLVMIPLLLVTIHQLPKTRSSRTFVTFAIVAGTAGLFLAFQFQSIHLWVSGVLGPQVWKGASVTLPQGAELLRGHHWGSHSEAAQIALDLIHEKGGAIGALKGFAHFIFSRPFLSLLLLAPWVILQPSFWFSALPLLGVYSILDAPSKFLNYYSAPLLGLFWLAASKRNSASHWILACSLVLGGAGIEFHFANDLTKQAKKEATSLIPCIGKRSTGMVTGTFLGIIPHESVWTDRDPALAPSAKEVDFYLFSKQIPSYELSRAAAEALYSRLENDPQWVSLGTNCLPRLKEETQTVFLFVKRAD